MLKALEIDDELAEAHASLGNVYTFYELNFPAAEKEYEKAISLKPGYATAHHWYAFLLAATKRCDEAVREISLARDLDPLAPRVAANVGSILYLCRRFDRAQEELEKAQEYFPNHITSWIYKGFCHAAQGHYEEAIKSTREAARISGQDASVYGARLACYYGLWGKKQEAEEWIVRAGSLRLSQPNPYLRLALAHAALGRIDEAFILIDKAIAARDTGLLFISADALFDPLRDDTRFVAILKKLGLDD